MRDEAHLEGIRLREAQKAEREAQHQRQQQEKAKKVEEIDLGEKIDEAFASNNWVIHGKHTKTGKPLLAGDPHLNNQLPSHWYLMEMTYDN